MNPTEILNETPEIVSMLDDLIDATIEHGASEKEAFDGAVCMLLEFATAFVTLGVDGYRERLIASE